MQLRADFLGWRFRQAAKSTFSRNGSLTEARERAAEAKLPLHVSDDMLKLLSVFFAEPDSAKAQKKITRFLKLAPAAGITIEILSSALAGAVMRYMNHEPEKVANLFGSLVRHHPQLLKKIADEQVNRTATRLIELRRVRTLEIFLLALKHSFARLNGNKDNESEEIGKQRKAANIVLDTIQDVLIAKRYEFHEALREQVRLKEAAFRDFKQDSIKAVDSLRDSIQSLSDNAPVDPGKIFEICQALRQADTVGWRLVDEAVRGLKPKVEPDDGRITVDSIKVAKRGLLGFTSQKILEVRRALGLVDEAVSGARQLVEPEDEHITFDPIRVAKRGVLDFMPLIGVARRSKVFEALGRKPVLQRPDDPSTGTVPVTQLAKLAA